MRRKYTRLVPLILAAIFFAPELVAYEQEIGRLASTMAEKISHTGKTRIAVVDFTDLQGRVTELGRFLAEEFSVALAGSGNGLRVVDRTHLKSILEEHKLATTGLIDPATARQLGKIAGVEALVTATITPFGDSVRLSIKVLDTESADVIDAATGNIAKTEAIAELLGSAVTSSTPSAPQPSPAKRSPQQAVAFGGVNFELLACKRSAQQVKCEFLVTALEEGIGVGLNTGVCANPRSRVFDSSGNEFVTAMAYVGTERSECRIRNQLVEGIPLKVGWAMEGIPTDLSSFSAVDFSCSISSPTNRSAVHRLQLRSVPVSE